MKKDVSLQFSHSETKSRFLFVYFVFTSIGTELGAWNLCVWIILKLISDLIKFISINETVSSGKRHTGMPGGGGILL